MIGGFIECECRPKRNRVRHHWKQLAADYRVLAEWLKLPPRGEDFKRLTE